VFNLGGFSTSDDEVSLHPMDVPMVESEQPRFGNASLLVSLGILGLALFGGGVLWILTVGAGSDSRREDVRLGRQHDRRDLLRGVGLSAAAPPGRSGCFRRRIVSLRRGSSSKERPRVS
jgi:hypothetical protein